MTRRGALFGPRRHLLLVHDRSCPGRVVDHRSGTVVVDTRTRLARRQLDALLVEARVALDAARGGDLVQAYQLHSAAGRAATLLFAHRLDVA